MTKKKLKRWKVVKESAKEYAFWDLLGSLLEVIGYALYFLVKLITKIFN